MAINDGLIESDPPFHYWFKDDFFSVLTRDEFCKKLAFKISVLLVLKCEVYLKTKSSELVNVTHLKSVFIDFINKFI